MNTLFLDADSGDFETGEQRPAFIHIAAWDELRERIASDSPRLARFSAEELRRRWSNGLAGIAVDATRIIAYTSLVEIPLNLGDDATRVFEASSGWTMPGHRRKNYQFRLRQRLYEACGETLMISFAVGLGAAFVLTKLGWTLYSWPDRLGVSDFIGKVDHGYLYHRLGDMIDLGGRQPYHVATDFDFARHDWDRWLHLWVSDAKKAARLRERILATPSAVIAP